MKCRTILLVACLAAWSGPLRAGSLEITPFLWYQFGGSFEDEETGQDYDIAEGSAAGALLDFRLSEITQLEFYFSHQETELKSGGRFPTDTLFDMDVEYYHIGGTVLIPDGDWEPFVVGTLGVTRLNPEPSSVGALTRFSLGLGGGIRYFPTKHLGLYLAGRGLFTFIDSDTSMVVESGNTTVYIVSDGLWQAILQAGLILRF